MDYNYFYQGWNDIYLDTVTDNLGNFQFNFSTYEPNDTLFLSFLDCDCQVTTDTIFFNQNQTTITHNFVYCDCDKAAGFTYSLNGNAVTCTPYYTPTGMTQTWTTNGTNSSAQNTYLTTLLPGQNSINHTVTISSANCVQASMENITYDTTGSLLITPIASGVSNASFIHYLIRQDSTAQGVSLTAVDSVVGMGQQAFNNLSPGDYLVKSAFTNPSDSAYLFFLPTYWVTNNATGALNWSNASTVTIVANASVSITNNLVQGINNGGPAFISGLVSQGANKMEGLGDPVPNVVVYVLDDQQNPVGYAVSDQQGAWSITGFSPGTYTLTADVLGRVTTPATVEIQPSTNGLDSFVVEVNSSDVTIYRDVTNSIKNAEVSDGIQLYPNPFSDEIRITSMDKAFSIEVIHMSGQLVYEATFLNVNTSIETTNWPSGMFILRWTTETDSQTVKLIKR